MSPVGKFVSSLLTPRAPVSARGRGKVWFCFALAAVSTFSIQAQEPARPALPPDPLPAVAPQPGDPRAYQTVYQHETAREYLQRRAQAKVEARQARLEGMKWMGYSPLRPTVTAAPFSTYAPTWGAFSVGHYWTHPYWHHPVNLGH